MSTQVMAFVKPWLPHIASMVPYGEMLQLRETSLYYIYYIYSPMPHLWLAFKRSGRWITDNTVYPLKDTRQLEEGQTFNAFKGYILPTKTKNAKVQVWRGPGSTIGPGRAIMHKIRRTPTNSSPVKSPRRNSREPASPVLAGMVASGPIRGPVQNSQRRLLPDNNNGQAVAQNQELHNDQKLLAYQRIQDASRNFLDHLKPLFAELPIAPTNKEITLPRCRVQPLPNRSSTEYFTGCTAAREIPSRFLLYC
ncbi:hypothetical protein H0G86_000317 [Trichoderma simmonsii]|uniref:Uncharacterized protein n=1 Tax=Trichoderma simmonsii TaxID=1491479 RepID=A0A8G0PBB6_9HYPO|nr:hypothetical protein H0G86_000317 [Trichoderma simmonsii]